MLHMQPILNSDQIDARVFSARLTRSRSFTYPWIAVKRLTPQLIFMPMLSIARHAVHTMLRCGALVLQFDYTSQHFCKSFAFGLQLEMASCVWPRILSNLTLRVLVTFIQLTRSVPQFFFWLWQKWVYQSLQYHTGLTHPFNLL